MSNEVRVQMSLNIRNGNLNHQSRPTSFIADMVGGGGPVPGQINVPVAGVNVGFATLDTMGGMCTLQNLDTVNFVTYGIWDSVTSKFLPLGELRPSEGPFLIRLSRELGREYGTGTGSTSSGDSLRLKADTATCKVVVNAFDA